MTKADFEKLVEKDPKRDEILNRVKSGVELLINDEEWYDICAEQYELCNGNIASFFYNLYKKIDFYKIKQANLKVMEKNDDLLIKQLENIHSKVASYIDKHPIEKANDEKRIKHFLDDIVKVIFSEYIEPRTLLEQRRKHLEDVNSLWEIVEKWEGTYDLNKISFSLNKDGGSYKITENRTINMLKDAISNRLSWLTPNEYLVSGKQLDKIKIDNDIKKIKNYDRYNFSLLRNHLIYEIFLLFVNYEFVEETDHNEYQIITKNNRCAVLTTNVAVWIYDLIVSIIFPKNKFNKDEKKEEEEKKDSVRDALRSNSARHELDFSIDLYRRLDTGMFTKYI